MISKRTALLKQSGIRSASVRCNASGGINLGQGICDIPAHDKIKQAAADAIFANKNLYGPHDGLPELKKLVTEKLHNFNKLKVDPINQVLISHGSTGAYVSAVMTLFNPGDEVILFEPFYGYHKYILELLGVDVVAVPVDRENYAIDFDLLNTKINNKTRGIVICTPCNPSGKVFSKAELIAIGELANKHNLSIITDEIYEYIVYPGHEHVSIASLNDYANRTVTISGFSKTFNITGWRLGYATGPAEIISKMALTHDLFYICPPMPLQHAMLTALSLGADYYDALLADFLHKKNLMVTALRDMGFKVTDPQGAYYLLADFSDLDFADDEHAVDQLLRHANVATVTGRSFYLNPKDGKHLLRFCFALNEDKIQQAMQNIRKFLK